ncbi:hypothetical protein J3R82DRAFT_6142 [Butyriboletus roseoflavus]|nr:hypothetical protein J3R82DRAFT_6142 [Butyriboletus roseoflavus]
MSEPLLTKRLHISGLTPSIAPADLERRLSSFGRVKAMNGFGARDALGDHRKFGFVTMEIGAKELAKCLNVLSGSTWKGAKLRIGEAKPDFREHLAQINTQPSRPVRPKRTFARNYGHPSSTLALTPLSATAAASTPGWIVTPSGRVVRPMRMRPERPLDPMRSKPSISKAKGVNGKVKKRSKPPPIRARRRLIDPTKWDSVYLKGVFLDTVSVPLPTSKSVPEHPIPVTNEILEEEGEDETEEEDSDSDALSSVVRKEIRPPQHILQLAQDYVHAMPSSQQLQEAALATSLRIHEATDSIDVRDEANTALVMLGKMFGDKEDWDGRESVTEMDDLEDNEARGKGMQVDGEEDIEVVSRDFGDGRGSKVTNDKGKGEDRPLGKVVRFGHEGGVHVEEVGGRDVEMEEIDPPDDIKMSAPTAEFDPQTNLKALFAPREQGLPDLFLPCLVAEEFCVHLASFSLLDHLDLDLDLELDADILGISAPSGAPQENGHLLEPILPTPQVVFFPATISTTQARSRVTLDHSLPLLFPPADSLPHLHTPSSNPATTIHQHTPTCTLFPSATRVRGLHYLPPSITFTRSPQDTPESIREWWEINKSSLTHEWKKAWREARGSRRRKVGAGGEAGGGY